MSTMAVVTQAETAQAVIRWAARFAKMRDDSLTVFCCLIGAPDRFAARSSIDRLNSAAGV